MPSPPWTTLSRLADTVAAYMALQARHQAEASGDSRHRQAAGKAFRAYPVGDRNHPDGGADQGPGQEADGEDPARVLSERADAGHPEGDGGKGTISKSNSRISKSAIKRKRLSQEAAAKVRAEFKKLKLMFLHECRSNGGSQLHRLDPVSAVVRQDQGQVGHRRIHPDSRRKTITAWKKPKERIIEYLAVQALVKKIKGPSSASLGLRGSERHLWPSLSPGP